MAKANYSTRLNVLKNRRHGTDLSKSAGLILDHAVLTESYEQLKEPETIKYVIGAMQPLDDKYTKNTYLEGDRVKNQLNRLKGNGYDIEFRYQGSVTNNTHIKAHSDIDILTIYLGFTTLEPPQEAKTPYKGDPIKDLCRLREDCYSILCSAFSTATVDNEGAKAITLKGGSLRRKVDVVPANWYDTVKYTETKMEYYRGVMVLDYKNKTRIANTPFYHNKLLNDKGISTAENYKKIVRLLKTLKADADTEIKISSYDIAALMYHMENNQYLVGDSPLLLIDNSLNFMRHVYNNDFYRNTLQVPDKSRKIFQAEGATQNDLKLLIDEIDSIYQDLLEDLRKYGHSINKQIIA